MVSAWGCRQRLVLAQIATDAKSNEITAAPKWIEMLALKGAIAEPIVEQKGDCALALKANQGRLYDDVVLLLEDPELKVSRSMPFVEADHGRIETRTATVSTEIDWLRKQHPWPGLKAIGKVARRRETAHKTTAETAYYLLSSELSPERFNQVARQHRGGGKQPALAIGRGDERGPGPHPHGAWTAQSRTVAPHGHQCHAKRRVQRLPARQVLTRWMGQ